MARTKRYSKRQAAAKRGELTQNSPTPWPMQIQHTVDQLTTRIADLEAKWSDLIATIKSEVQREWARQKDGQP
jgi:hypothetical protein